MGVTAAAMDGGQPVRVRDSRRANWFWIENVLVDVFQPVIGPLGCSVYQALVREAGRSRRVRTRLEPQQVDLTLREIGELAGVSKDTAQRLLKKMLTLRMISELRDSRRVIYELNDLQDAAAPGIAALRLRLDEMPAAPPQPKIERSASRDGWLFDDGEGGAQGAGNRAQGVEGELGDEVPAGFDFHQAAEDAHALGMMEDAPKAVSHRDKAGDEAAKGLSQKSGGFVSQRDALVSGSDVFVSHGATPSIQEEKTKTEDLNPPPTPPAGRGAEPLAMVLAGLGSLTRREGDLSDLRGQAERHMLRAGFSVARDRSLPDRGDGRVGFVDLWCERGPVMGKTERVAIEFDAVTPRQRSVEKLRRCEAVRVLILRLGKVIQPIEGLHKVIAMGWPGASARERDQTQLARTRVGMPAPAEPAAEGVQEPGSASVRAVFAAVREQVAGLQADGLDDAVAEWDHAFASVSYERHELAEASSAGILLVVSSPDPPATVSGLRQYSVRIEREMQRSFGSRVQVQVVGGNFYAGGDHEG